MKLPRRNFLHLAAGAAALPAVSRVARALAYPLRPVRLIVGWPPGGGADQVARLIAPSLSDRLGQQVVIENRPGAGTFLSVQAVLNSAPDGYTLLHYGGSTLMNVKISANPPPLEEGIAPVAGLVAYPMILVAHPLFPAKTVPELIDYAKANPGKVTMASFGIGTASHLAGELLKQMACIEMVHVPYRGGAPMITDLVAGQVQIGFDVMVTSLPHVRTGALRALAVAGSRRGYEVAKGQYLIVEDAELERSRSKAHTPSRLTALCRAPRSTSASSIALITRSRQNPAPSCLIPGAAAQTQVVSVAKIRLDRRKSTRLFKGIISSDISEFESHMPSQAVSLWAMSGLQNWSGSKPSGK